MIRDQIIASLLMGSKNVVIDFSSSSNKIKNGAYENQDVNKGENTLFPAGYRNFARW